MASEDSVLEERAEAVVKRTLGRGALGKGKAGETALIVAPPDQDEKVLEVVRNAMRDRGLEEVIDVVTEQEVLGASLDEFELMSGADGWKEALWIEENARMLGSDFSLTRDTIGMRSLISMRDWLARTKREYDAIYMGFGGRAYYQHFFGEFKRMFRDNWIYVTKEDLLSDEPMFPAELQRLAESKIIEVLPRIADVRVSDPEGTRFTFSVEEALTPEDAQLWAIGANAPAHLFMYPAADSRILAGGAGYSGDGLGRHVFPKGNGVIVGCANHFGFFPRIRIYVRDGVIDRIEGGGRYGELMRELEAKTRHVQYPGFPKPGYLYLMEMALGTHPKMGVRKSNLFSTYLFMPNVWERNQAGVIHWGFGAESPNADFIQYAEENGLPKMHGFHVHTYFNTYEARLRGSNEWIKLLDNGRITAFDSDEVQKEAAKYGDPNQILADSWRPRIPGVNYPGDYLRDYARNPVPWIRSELEGRLPLTIGTEF